MLAHDSRFRDDVRNAARDVQAITAAVASGESLAGELLVRRDIEETTVGKTVLVPLEEFLADLGVASRNLREGRGVAGLLFSDQETAEDVRALVRSFRRATEDAREAAPIAVLVAAFAAAF
jgi:hypothetical protein